MLTLLSINKILAIYVGPSGYAAVGQFNNAVQMITTIASGAINNGIVKYTAEYEGEVEKQKILWRTAGTISLIGAIVTAILVSLTSSSLAVFFLNDVGLSSVFTWFSISLVFFIFNTFLLAILNGKNDIHRYVASNICGSIFSLFITGLLSYYWGLYGALVALAVYQSLNFFATIVICLKANWFKIDYLIGEIDKNVAKNLGKYALMALSGAICLPLSHILIRDHLVNTLGMSSAGYWEAMWRLSAAYLLFVTTTLSVYYLPKLSSLKNSEDIKSEILNGYMFILPIAAICSYLIYNFRDSIILILFTNDFTPMREIFAWQLVGDTLKIGSWILSYLMISKAMVKSFITLEIIFSISFYMLTLMLTDIYGIQGVVLAHAINYFIYWIVVFNVVKKLDEYKF